MSRIDEIRERVEACEVYYTYDGRKVATIEADADMRYLLDRIAKLESLRDAAKEHREYANRKQGTMQWVCECSICKALDALDNDDEKETKHEVQP